MNWLTKKNNVSENYTSAIDIIEERIKRSNENISKLGYDLQHSARGIENQNLSNWLGRPKESEIKDAFMHQNTAITKTIQSIGSMITDSNQNTNDLSKMFLMLSHVVASIYKDVLTTNENENILADKYENGLKNSNIANNKERIEIVKVTLENAKKIKQKFNKQDESIALLNNRLDGLSSKIKNIEKSVETHNNRFTLLKLPNLKVSFVILITIAISNIILWILFITGSGSASV